MSNPESGLLAATRLRQRESSSRALVHEHDALGERQRKAGSLLAEIERELEVCFTSGSDDLARKVVRRKLETERLERHVAERKDALAKEIATLRAAVDEQREQLDVMRQKAELLTGAAGGDARRDDFAVGEAEVEVAYLRERQKRQPS